MRYLFFLIFSFLLSIQLSFAQTEKLKLAVAGFEHGHINGFLRQVADQDDFELVGYYEPKADLAKQVMSRFDLDPGKHYNSLSEMLKATSPDLTAIFSSTYDHPQLVEVCARQKANVMMEKPLAVNMEHARRIKTAVEENDILLMVNYETTWYPSNHLAKKTVEKQQLGDIRKMVVHSGHKGPKEIGVGPYFLDWLTDPKLNGGGALMDFGCYGANLMTWLMNNERPLKVSAITQQIKPDVYPEVEDEATIIITYPQAQGIIQASWNWPFSRKDLEVYGQTGNLIAHDNTRYSLHLPGKEEFTSTVEQTDFGYQSPLALMADVIHGNTELDGLSSLENNLIVTEILEAALKSARLGEVIQLDR